MLMGACPKSTTCRFKKRWQYGLATTCAASTAAAAAGGGGRRSVGGAVAAGVLLLLLPPLLLLLLLLPDEFSLGFFLTGDGTGEEDEEDKEGEEGEGGREGEDPPVAVVLLLKRRLLCGEPFFCFGFRCWLSPL